MFSFTKTQNFLTESHPLTFDEVVSEEPQFKFMPMYQMPGQPMEQNREPRNKPKSLRSINI